MADGRVPVRAAGRGVVVRGVGVAGAGWGVGVLHRAEEVDGAACRGGRDAD